MISDLSRTKARPGLFDDDGKFFPFQQEARSIGGVRIAWHPVFRHDVIEFQAQEGVEQVLHIVLIFHFERRSIFPSQSELSGDGMKAGANLPDQFKSIRYRANLRSCGARPVGALLLRFDWTTS